MSIFRETLPKYVQEQLTTRTEVISSTNTRSAPFLSYVSGKNGWVRLSSFVNYNDPKGAYSGDELAKKYILEGGTLSRKGNEERLRFGLGTSDGAYLSNLDGFNAKGQAPKNKTDFRPLGIRPMPGITNVDIVNKSAYGSLKEATVRYYCWDKHQLEELELLYMRTGYTVLLEWGWSEYLESPTSIKNIGQGIEIFGSALTDENVYNQIESYKEKYKGNYDALLGHIKNFSWQLMPNGGYECSTVIISRGEIISTLRLSSNTNDPNATPGENDKPLSTFERIFLNYKAWINRIEVDSDYIASAKSKTADDPDAYKTSPSEFKPIYKEDNKTYVDNPINETSVDNFVKELEAKITSIPKFYIYGYDAKGNWLNSNAFSTGAAAWNSIKKNKGVAIICDAGANDGTAIEYIRLDHFLYIINAYFNLKDKDKNLIAKILIPQYLPILSSEDSVSVDPKTCLIRNTAATFITDSDIIVSNNLNDTGFQPYTITEFTYDPASGKRIRTANRKSMLEFHLGKNLTGKVPSNKEFSFGVLDNIYISINKIVDLYRSKGGNNPDGVLVIDYLKDLLSQISSALGGINDFQLHVEKDQIKIIDVKYLEVETGNKTSNFNKYNFDLFGLKSICRDVKISSRIFDSQATMIAIAAQNRNNIGDLYSSTQTYFNQGLTDRLLPTKIIADETQTVSQYSNDATLNYYVELWTSISSISYYLRSKCIGIKDNSNITDFGSIKVPTDADINNAKSVLKTLTYQINGKDVDYKAIIPFELELTLDGISGLIVGQIFTVDKSILPKDYATKNLGFIITGLSHSLQNNDWITTVKTQVCLLDQDELASTFSFSKNQKKKIKENLAKIKSQAIRNQYLAYAITDFLYTKIIAILGSPSADHPEKTYEIGTKFLSSTPIKLANGTSLTIPADTFDDFLPKWIKRIQKDQPAIYSKKDSQGNLIFPQTVQDLTTFSLDGTNKFLFNTNVADIAFAGYNKYSLNGQSSTVTTSQGSNVYSIKQYFSISDPNPSSFNQNAATSAKNSALWSRITKFNDTYPDEFVGNIIYVNSIFGRGLSGTITLLGYGTQTTSFNLDNQGDNDGLKVNAQSKEIDVSNYKTGEQFYIANTTSGYEGKNSQIEKWLTSRIIADSDIAYNNPSRQDVWNKIFEYVTKDLLTAANKSFIDPAFAANFSLLSQINDIKPTSDVSGNASNYVINSYATTYIN
jgi:hypothetical protein